jgi:uncharacterized protein YidB (DUF937 family)
VCDPTTPTGSWNEPDKGAETGLATFPAQAFGAGRPANSCLLALESIPMGLFDGLLGGIVGAGMVSVVSDIIDKHGGLNGVVNQFQRQGFGDTVRSWVSTGQNQPISPDEIHKALGADTMNELAAKLGMTPQELATKLSAVLPQAIDKLTPAGVVPPGQ